MYTFVYNIILGLSIIKSQTSFFLFKIFVCSLIGKFQCTILFNLIIYIVRVFIYFMISEIPKNFIFETTMTFIIVMLYF